MERLRRELANRERIGEPVRVGLVGAGQMGLGLAAVLGRMPGMRLVAVADLLLDRALDAFRHAGVRRDEIAVGATPPMWPLSTGSPVSMASESSFGSSPQREASLSSPRPTTSDPS